MKTFNDLTFEKHPNASVGLAEQAKMFFGNGYGVSVIMSSGSYSDEQNPYELAVLKGTEDEWDLTYDTDITDNVLGYLTSDDVTNIMKKV